MRTMKAFVRTDSHTTNVALTEVMIPILSKNEVLVKVEAFGVGVHDRYFIPTDATFPYPIGSEGAGVIAQLGSEITKYHMGDRVILSSALQPTGGCWAEYVAVSSANLVLIPDGMDFTNAAAIPVAGKTALECIRALDLKTGDTLFIAGASGAIGTLVIQLASNLGIRVIASSSSKNHEYMRLLGADMAVDYSNPNWKDEVTQFIPGGVDASLAIQRETAKDCMDVVKNNGKVITVSGDQIVAERGITVQQFLHQLDMHQAVNSLVQDIVAGQIRVVIDHVYPFEQALEALTTTETRHARGKLIVKNS